MNDDTKYRDRLLAGVLISRLLNKTGLSAKLAVVAGGIGIPAVVVAGLYFGVDLDLDTEPLPEPPPLIEPLNETSTPAALPETDEASPHQTPTPATAPTPTEEEPDMDTDTEGEYVAALHRALLQRRRSTAEVIQPVSLARSHIDFRVPSPTATPDTYRDAYSRHRLQPRHPRL